MIYNKCHSHKPISSILEIVELGNITMMVAIIGNRQIKIVNIFERIGQA